VSHTYAAKGHPGGPPRANSRGRIARRYTAYDQANAPRTNRPQAAASPARTPGSLSNASTPTPSPATSAPAAYSGWPSRRATGRSSSIRSRPVAVRRGEDTGNRHRRAEEEPHRAHHHDHSAGAARHASSLRPPSSLDADVRGKRPRASPAGATGPDRRAEVVVDRGTVKPACRGAVVGHRRAVSAVSP
jgi:hypothetical protein